MVPRSHNLRSPHNGGHFRTGKGFLSAGHGLPHLVARIDRAGVQFSKDDAILACHLPIRAPS